VVDSPVHVPSGLLDKTERLVSALDVTIGKGLKGRIGVSAVAQLQILEELSLVALALEFGLAF
jgi:hypothetical protein